MSAESKTLVHTSRHQSMEVYVWERQAPDGSKFYTIGMSQLWKAKGKKSWEDFPTENLEHLKLAMAAAFAWLDAHDTND